MNKFYLDLAITYFSCSLTLLIAAYFSIQRIYNTSKAKFGYILLAFTALYGVNYLYFGSLAIIYPNFKSNFSELLNLQTVY